MTKRTTFSRLYDCEVTHVRTVPVKNAFCYSYSTFCLDLDEAEQLQGLFFGLRWWNVFRFVPSDFIFGKNSRSSQPSDLKLAIQAYAREKGVRGIERIELVAHMRTFGYAFNPAAFYFCYDKNNVVLCAILEVTNTFREKKAYFIAADGSEVVSGMQTKNFYVSPFVDLNADFEFKLGIPRDRLKFEINSLKDQKRIVHSVLAGNVVEWNNASMLKSLVKFPFITLQVISKIHFRAFVLYLKRVPYFKKKERFKLQKGGLS